MAGRSIFDITGQNYGRLDESILVANDNGVSINSEVTTDLTLEDYEGDIKKKNAIASKGLTFNNDFAEVETGVKGLLDFDGVDDRVVLASHPDVTGSKIISFYVYFKTSGVTQAEGIFVFGSNNSDYFDATYITNVERLRIAVSTSGGSIDYDISGIMNTKVLIEVVKTTGGIVSTKANGVALPIFVTGSGNSATSASTIGHHPDVGVFQYLGSAYVWNIAVDGIIICNGQPDGNTDAAWSQSIAATVFGSPSTIDLP